MPFYKYIGKSAIQPVSKPDIALSILARSNLAGISALSTIVEKLSEGFGKLYPLLATGKSEKILNLFIDKTVCNHPQPFEGRRYP